MVLWSTTIITIATSLNLTPPTYYQGIDEFVCVLSIKQMLEICNRGVQKLRQHSQQLKKPPFRACTVLPHVCHTPVPLSWAWFSLNLFCYHYVSLFFTQCHPELSKNFPLLQWCVKSKLRVCSHVKQQAIFRLTTLGRKMARFQLVMASS